jgi:hypothetical protein
MDDIIGLFTDFEKKFLALIRDLIGRPKAVLAEVMKREKKYAAPFRIYSYVVSLSVLLVVILNYTGAGFFVTENRHMPLFWENYEKSKNDFILTMVPILGFLEVILIFSIFTYVLFRKPAASLFQHLKFNTYVISVIAIYYVIMLAAFNVLQYYYPIGNVWVIRTVFLIVPALMFLNSFRAFQNAWYWIFLKGVSIIAIASFIMVRIFFAGNFNERLHAFAMYWKYHKNEVKATQTSASIPLSTEGLQFQDLIIDSFNSFSGIARTALDSAILLKSNLLGEIEFTRKISLPQSQGEFGNYIGAAEIPVSGKNDYLFFLEKQSDGTFTDHPVDIYHLSHDHTTLLGSINAFTANTTCRYKKDQIFFSLYNHGQNTPYLMSMDTIGQHKRAHFLLGMENWVIGDFQFDNSGDSVLILAHHENEKQSLSQVALVKAVLTDSSFQSLSKTLLYDNPYSDRINHRTGDLSKSKISKEKLFIGSDSGTFVASYRIFTDKSFALKVSLVEEKTLSQRWSRDINLPYDLVYFDDVIVKDHAVIIAGRAYQLITNGFLETPYYRPFVMKLDESTGENTDFAILEQHYPVENFESSLIFNPSKVFYEDNRVILFHYFNDVLHRTEVSLKSESRKVSMRFHD